MKIEDSALYKHLKFYQKFGVFSNAMEIFHTIMGYRVCMNAYSNSFTYDNWVADFETFIEHKLLDKYFNNDYDRLPRNYAEIIIMHQTGDSDGIKLFYAILDEFVKK